MSELPFPTIVVPGRDAVEARRELQVRPGIVPVFLGAPAELPTLIDNLAWRREPPDAILRRANDFDVAAWYEARHADDPAAFTLDEGEWPDPATPSAAFTAILSPDTGELLDQVVIGLLPVNHSWEVPALLGYGGWGDCPYPHEHVALFKSWHERFGAAVASVVDNLIEFEVARPPLDRDAAEQLAMEHFLYARAVVRHDDGTLAELAATLLFGSVWSLWWE